MVEKKTCSIVTLSDIHRFLYICRVRIIKENIDLLKEHDVNGKNNKKSMKLMWFHIRDSNNLS